MSFAANDSMMHMSEIEKRDARDGVRKRGNMAITWLLLFVTIGCEVVATLSLRASEGFSKPLWAIPVIAGYVVCFWLLSIVLERGMPTALAYGVWSCVGIILTAFAARVLFHDPLNAKMLAGMAIMIIGIIVMQSGAHAAA